MTLIHTPPTLESWYNFINYGDVLCLNTMFHLWNPQLSEETKYLIYNYLITTISQGKSNLHLLDWVLSNLPLVNMLNIKSLILHTCFNLEGNTVTCIKARANTASKLVSKYQILFGDKLVEFIISFLCNDHLSSYRCFHIFNTNLSLFLPEPIILANLPSNSKTAILLNLKSISKFSKNYDRLNTLLGKIEFTGKDMAEIITHIKNPPNQESLYKTIRLLVNKYMLLNDQYHLSFVDCHPENHSHDPKTFEYIINALDETYINLDKSFKNLLINSASLKSMRESLEIVNYSPGIMVSNLHVMFFQTTNIIPDTRNKFSYIITKCKEPQFIKLYNYFKLFPPEAEPTFQYFILCILLHPKAIARCIRKMLFRKRVTKWLRKCRLFHEFSLLPANAYFYGFPGGGKFRDLNEKYTGSFEDYL